MAYTVGDEKVKIIKLELGPFGTNAYIVVCKATGDSVLVDAPAETGQILRQLDNTNPRYILITHSHFDHIGALGELKSKLGIPVALHPFDANKLQHSPDIELNDGDIVNIGLLAIKVLHTPGHTPGSVCFLVGRYLLAGDTIFPGGPGKTGTPADFKEIVKSIETKILVLPDNTEIFPGHGVTTILEREKKAFAIFASKSHAPDLYGDVLWLST